ncbi:ELKS/Rab6-interacting/CAST family member 1 [Pangasianodon hypophthalmus]|uniref:ELKS/Rab6-interacting/CAST family member 1 n=1 Tax=Pangasianodon hypophthalmus TaxID=310915 RepID=UPI0023075D8E|nr:ELKS/Rab6-interacting/CAST family member 1 [Pangasianodon hypophthalmus]
MARRRGKSSSKQDDSWLPLEPPAGQSSRGFNEYVIPGVLLLILAVGGSVLGWVCSDHQQTIDSLSETLASMQARITKLQQQLGTDNAQLANVGGFEERLLALEDAYAKAQRQVELALATSEQIKSKDLQSKVWSLQTEMNDKLAELQQNTISIAALNAIIKNKSIEFEVVKQSVNTMLSANAELAVQISGFSSTLSVTKLHLDEQISIVDGLMSQLEGQKREINEIKELFASNQESLATNARELLDVKELLESEQIKRTQNLEKQLRSLYKRLEDHQTNTESLHFQLAAQLEALQIQFSPGVQQPSRAEEEVQVEEQVTTSDNKKKKAPEKELENTVEEEFTEEEELRDNRELAAVEEVEASDWPVEEPVKEIQTPSDELDIEIEGDVAEEQNEVDITEEIETLQEAHMVTNEIEETVVDEIQTALEDSDRVTVETGEIMDENMEVNVGEEIKIHSEKANMVTSETEKQTEVPDAEEIQTLLEDSTTATTETEEAAVGKQEESTPAQEMQTGSEETDALSNTPDEVFSEEHAEHAAEEIHNVSDEISTAEIKTQEDGNAEQESGTAVEEIQIASDETEIATNGNVDNQMREVIPAEIEQEAMEEPRNQLSQKNQLKKCNG